MLCSQMQFNLFGKTFQIKKDLTRYNCNESKILINRLEKKIIKARYFLANKYYPTGHFRRIDVHA